MFAPDPIKFGTDGWRAVIADAFTFERVAQVAQASARILTRTYPGHGILIGYDNRFLSEHFAQRAAEAVAALGIPVKLSTVAAPTPALSWAAHQQGAHGALVITASHNPPQYSGIKVKGGFGGSVPAEVTHDIERELIDGSTLVLGSQSTSSVEMFDPWPAYLQQLTRFVDLDQLKTLSAKVWVDSMFGSAAGGMTRLLGDKVHEVRGYRDPLFGGYAPEPLPPQLAPTMTEIAADPAALKVGIVFDGDGDRIAAIDGKGTFLSPQILIPILIEHLAKRRGLTGEVVKTVSGSQLFDKVTTLYGLPLTETAVGFKYIAERMMDTAVLLGGEESGGIGYLGHIPERDAMLSALYLLEAIAQTGEDLTTIYRRIQSQVGYVSTYDRIDLKLDEKERQTRLLASLHSDPFEKVAGRKVTRHITTDGHKFVLEDGNWLMVRGSGTEPLLRLYCEGINKPATDEILAWAKDWALR